jgi:hypothetical protein
MDERWAARSRQYRDRKNKRRRETRLQPERRAYWMHYDAKNMDCRLGLKNDLTEDFVKDLIKDGCKSCGTADIIRMSLDRIDNNLPHMQNNVIASCIECNLTRGSMPYEAWLVVAAAMRAARERGLLNGWKRRA